MHSFYTVARFHGIYWYFCFLRFVLSGFRAFYDAVATCASNQYPPASRQGCVERSSVYGEIRERERESVSFVFFLVSWFIVIWP